MTVQYFVEFTPEVNAIIDGYFSHWLDAQKVAEYHHYQDTAANDREFAAADIYERMVREARAGVRLAESARIIIKLPPTVDADMAELDDYDATVEGASWRNQ